jgi:hypothetical protein
MWGISLLSISDCQVVLRSLIEGWDQVSSLLVSFIGRLLWLWYPIVSKCCAGSCPTTKGLWIHSCAILTGGLKPRVCTTRHAFSAPHLKGESRHIDTTLTRTTTHPLPWPTPGSSSPYPRPAIGRCSLTVETAPAQVRSHHGRNVSRHRAWHLPPK